MIENIKLGIKIKIDKLELLPQIYSNKEVIDFIEVLLPPDFEVNDLKAIKQLQLPYNIHLPHFTKRIDFGNIKQTKHNQRFIERINFHIKSFNKLNPSCYIIHPESGDIQLSITNMKKLKIRPLALENMPYKSLAGGHCLAHDLNSIGPFFQQIPDLEFCLDLNHVVKTSISKSINYLDSIHNFIKFKKPIHFHISDGNLDSEFDEHLALGEGQYDLSEIKKVLFSVGTTVSLTFETPRKDKDDVQDDLKNMKYFIEI